MKKYYTKVIEEDGEIVVVFPEELLKELNFHDNEILEWQVDDNKISIRKVKYIDNSIKE